MSKRKVSAERRWRMIAEAAYFRAERRGFAGGDPLRDWTEAEAEVDARLNGQSDRDAVVAEFEARLATAKKKLTALKKKVAGMQAGARAEWQKDLERLASLRDTLETRLAEMREHGEQATHKVKEQGEKVWHEIAEIIERTSARRKTRSRT